MGLRRSLSPLLLVAVLSPASARAELVPVRYPEGLVHGFLTLRSADGTVLGSGDLIQFASAGRVTTRLLLRFKDGSLHDETTVFTQEKQFQLVSDHLVQKGPSFPYPMEVSIEARTGNVRVDYTDGGKPRTVSERMDLPADLANGLVLTLIKNLDPKTARTTVSMVAATPKPRLVRLVITPAGENAFEVGGAKRQAARFVVHMELGGVAGILAPLLGQQPADTQVWILEGDAPAFIGSQAPMAPKTPPWRLELASPALPASAEPPR